MNIGQQLVNGLVLGHAYALIAVGWTVLLGAAKLVNFGHGQMYMLGAFLCWFAVQAMGLPYALGVPIAVIGGIAVGAVMQRVMLRLTLDQNLVSLMIVTLGFGLVIEGSAGLAFGSKPQIIASPLNELNVYWENLWFTGQDLLVVAAAIVAFALLQRALGRTRLGWYVKMVAEDPQLARLSGIDVKLVYLGIFAFEGAAVALAASVVAPRTPILTSMGFEEVIVTFVVVVLGGIGSILGSYLAGLGLGLFTAFFGALVSPAYTTAAAFAVLIVILVLRPGGLVATGGRS